MRLLEALRLIIGHHKQHCIAASDAAATIGKSDDACDLSKARLTYESGDKVPAGG